jgi:hypothetical protein
MRVRASPTALAILVAVVIRTIVVLLLYQGFPPGWGGEMSAVAESLVSGHGFASPYFTPTGPTALVPPAYPFLLSGLFWLIGNHQPAAGVAALAINVVLSSVICVPIAELGTRLFDERSGHVGAWIWALAPLTG